jgi:hypothetical protein
METVICLTGLSSCGKSYMTGHYFKPKGFQVLSLATPIYEILSFISQEKISHLHLTKKQPDKLAFEKNTRELLCAIGQGLREYISNDIWVDLCIKEIEFFLTATYCNRFIIDDIRDVNEYNKIRKTFKTKLIYVYREDNNPYLSSDPLVQERESHYEELKKYADLVFDNTIPRKNIHNPVDFYNNTLDVEVQKWL